MTGDRLVRRITLLAIAYVTTAALTRALFQMHDASPILWPPTGIALAALLLGGPRLWPGVAIGALVVALLARFPISVAVWLTATSVGEALVGYWLLARVAKIHTSLDRVRDVVALAVVAFATSLAATLVGVAGFAVFERVFEPQVQAMFVTWLWGHLSADLVIAPVILTWGTRTSLPDRSHPRAVEIIVVALGVALVDLVLVTSYAPHWLPVGTVPYYLLPLLLWAGLRFGVRGAATASCATALIVISTTALGGHPFERLSDLRSFVSISSLTTLVLSAIAVERFRANQRKAAIQTAALDAIVSIDESNAVIEFNPAAERMFAYRATAVLGRDGSMLVPEHRRPNFYRAIQQLRSSSAALFVGQRYRTPILRSDGQEIMVELAIASVGVDGEQLITGFIRDLTGELAAARVWQTAQEALEARVDERTAELTRANRELRRREELFQQAEELAHIGSFELDLATRQLRWSDELYRIYGRDPDTYTPSYAGFIDAVEPVDRSRVADTVQHAIEKMTSFSFDERILRPDGSTRLLQSRGKVYHNGVATRVTGCSQDVTQQRADEEARFRLVDIAQSSEDAIIGLSIDGTIESWNTAAERIFGYTLDEVIGRSSAMLVERASAPDLQDALVRSGTGVHVAHYELVHRRKDGSLFDASVTTSPIRDRSDHVIGLSKILRDVSDQKASEHELKASLAEKEVLLREIHHRVKNNLQVISSLLNLQVSGEGNELARKGLLESQSRIQSMALVHQQLYQSKDLARLDFTEYLEKLAQRLLGTYNVGPDRIELEVRGPSIRLDVDQAIPCGLIVNELIANAIDHAFPEQRHGHIRVILDHVSPERLALTVADDGIGLPPELRIETTPTFGLRIARTLTAQLGGTIAIARDHGTSIRIEFPLANHLAAAA